MPEILATFRLDCNCPNLNKKGSGVWHVWQSTQELVDYAKQCCVIRPLTDAERQQFGLK